LTLGRPVPLDLSALGDEEAAVALAMAQPSRHPLAKALASSLGADGVTPAIVADIEELPGLGLTGLYQGKRVRLGRPAWAGVSQATGEALACGFGIEGEPAHILEFSDRLRPDAGDAVRQLSVLALDPVIISGDRREAVMPVAAALHLSAMVGMSPADKVQAISRLTAAGHKVLVVGDGLNDGPALAAGHVSIAPSSASDVGQNAADIVFLGDSLSPVPIAVAAARRAMRVVRQNFALAIGYNILAVPLALAGKVTPLIAAIAMSTSSIIVIANALRLRRCAR